MKHWSMKWKEKENHSDESNKLQNMSRPNWSNGANESVYGTTTRILVNSKNNEIKQWWSSEATNSYTDGHKTRC